MLRCVLALYLLHHCWYYSRTEWDNEQINQFIHFSSKALMQTKIWCLIFIRFWKASIIQSNLNNAHYVACKMWTIVNYFWYFRTRVTLFPLSIRISNRKKNSTSKRSFQWQHIWRKCCKQSNAFSNIGIDKIIIFVSYLYSRRWLRM